MIPFRDAIIGAAIVAAVLGGLYLKGRSDGRQAQAPAVEAAQDAAASGQLTAEGQAATTARVEALLNQTRKTQEATHALVAAARQDPAGASPLEPAGADRLRAHDRLLCDARPAVCTPEAGGS